VCVVGVAVSYFYKRTKSKDRNAQLPLTDPESAIHPPTSSLPPVSSTPPAVHCFLTHNWGEDKQGRDNHKRVGLINNALKKRGMTTWFDDERMRGDIVMEMTQGIDNSLVTIVFLTEVYIEKVSGTGSNGMNDNCKVEFDYAVQRKRVDNIIPVVMEPNCTNTPTWTGAVGAYLSSKLYYDFTDDDRLHNCVDTLVSEIERRITQQECKQGDAV